MKNIFRLFAIFLLFVVCSFAARQTEMRRIGPRGQTMQKVHTDRVLVELTSPVHRSEFRVLTPGRGRFKNVVQVEVSPPFTPEGFIVRLKEEDSRTGQRRVKRAELSPVVTLRGVPNDRFWRNQWYFGADQGFQVPSIGFYNSSGLDMSHGLVYVADTGCPANHEDLDPETVVDRQKFVDDNFPGDSRDRNGHGTAVIGIMAAKTNNGVGIASMTPDVKVGCVQALDEFGEGDLLGLINMLDYVSSLQSQRKSIDPLAWLLLNLSLGGYGYSELLEEAKDRCAAAGVMIVAAAGNNGFNLSRDVYDWFCSKPSPHIVVVGATDLSDQPANFGGGFATNYGSSVDVFAPGVGIAALGLNGYATERGTSFATPIVTSTVALMLAKHPDITPKAIKQRLMNGDPFKGRQVGVNFVSRLQYSRNGVRLNVEKALSEDLAPPTTPLVTMSRVGHASVYQEISVSDDQGIFGCEVLLAESEGGEFTRHGELTQNFVNGLAVLSVPVEEGMVYYRAIQCYDTVGNASELSPIERFETPVGRTLSQYEGGSNELTVIDGPTAPLFPAKLGRPSGLLWKPLEQQWVVSGEEILETDAGDNHLKIPIDLTQVSESADATMSVTLEGEFTVLSSDFRSFLGDSSAVQRSEGLLELWVLSPDLPDGGKKLADIPNTADAQTFDASLVLRYPGASLSIRTFVDGNRGAVKLRTVTVRVDEK